ncbi:MAG: molybdenum cofactor guanylyltransferase [Acidobacteriota bacterium]
MLDVEGFILVGGASSRMGSDKARLIFGGQTGVQRIAAQLKPLADKVRVVGSRTEPGDSDFENVPDLLDRWGALGGIHSALSACRASWAVVVACDLPLVTSDLFVRLWELKAEKFDAIVPIQPDGRPQPLCAIYRRETNSAEAARLIAANEHTPRALLAQVRTRWVEFRELADLPGAEHFFLNVNTPADYEHAQQLLESRSRAR